MTACGAGQLRSAVPRPLWRLCRYHRDHCRLTRRAEPAGLLRRRALASTVRWSSRQSHRPSREQHYSLHLMTIKHAGGRLEGGFDMARDRKSPDTVQTERIRIEINAIDEWAMVRVLAFRSQRDFWQRLTYILLAVSAGTAIGAAISAGLKAQLSTIIFAGVSAGLSVVTASLKTPTQITKSETALATIGALRAKIRAFQTDLPDLSAQSSARQLEQVRRDYREALKLHSPSDRRLAKAADALQRMSEYDINVRAYPSVAG